MNEVLNSAWYDKLREELNSPENTKQLINATKIAFNQWQKGLKFMRIHDEWMILWMPDNTDEELKTSDLENIYSIFIIKYDKQFYITVMIYNLPVTYCVSIGFFFNSLL